MAGLRKSEPRLTGLHDCHDLKSRKSLNHLNPGSDNKELEMGNL